MEKSIVDKSAPEEHLFLVKEADKYVLSLPLPGLDCCFCIGVGNKGRGLFASKDIPPNTVIHVAPCIAFSREAYEEHLKYTILEHYLFNDKCSSEAGSKLLALGYGSLFNHSNSPNISYRVDTIHQTITYTSSYKRIFKDEELCISYGSNLWFKDADDNRRVDDSSDDELQADGLASFLQRLELGKEEDCSSHVD
jgi:SET domain-containing protein